MYDYCRQPRRSCWLGRLKKAIAGTYSDPRRLCKRSGLSVSSSPELVEGVYYVFYTTCV
jgi:hypothetical protein